MAKMTLLDIVQDILNDLDADSVNSISDTVESQQVAQIVKTTFFNIVDGKNYPHFNELFQLTGLGLTAKPNYMQIPETIESIEWIKYNCKLVSDTRDKYKNIQYLTPEEFITYVDNRNSDSANVLVVSDFSGVPLNILDDKAPTYFTSFDDNYIVFDSYDSGIDSTLTSYKSSCRGKRNVTFTISNEFIPDLPVQMFSYLLSEAKATAFTILKQSVNPKAEQNSLSQKRRMSNQAWKTTRGITIPNYGRK